jgi:hypothetical protein
MTHDVFATDRNIDDVESDYDSVIKFAPSYDEPFVSEIGLGNGPLGSMPLGGAEEIDQYSANFYALVKSLLSAANAVDDNIIDVYHETHVGTATGESLDKFGTLVNTPRKSSESDEKYRARLKAQFAQVQLSGTYNEFTQFVGTVLDTDVSNITFTTAYDANPATITVRVDSKIFTENNLTASEVIDLLGGGVPAGHEVEVQESGSFRIKNLGQTDDADKGLVSDGNPDGGTLTSDL